MKKHDLSSLRYLFLAGEPLDEPTARWAADALGVRHRRQLLANRERVADPVRATRHRRHAAQIRQPVVPRLRLRRAGCCDEVTGSRSRQRRKGVLAILPPLPPGCMTTVWGDDKRFVETYFSTFPDRVAYSTFDWATRDDDGYYFVLGRTDDVINVAGHRLGTREIEEAVQAHPGIAEVAVVGVADAVKGQMPVAFAVVKDPASMASAESIARMRKEVMDTVDRQLGAIARPGQGALRRRCCRKRAPGSFCGARSRPSPRDAHPGTSRPSRIPPHSEQIRQALAS